MHCASPQLLLKMVNSDTSQKVQNWFPEIKSQNTQWWHRFHEELGESSHEYYKKLSTRQSLSFNYLGNWSFKTILRMPKPCYLSSVSWSHTISVILPGVWWLMKTCVSRVTSKVSVCYGDICILFQNAAFMTSWGSILREGSIVKWIIETLHLWVVEVPNVKQRK